MMLNLGLQDPRMNFVKKEPHSDKKKTDRQWRIIWNVSFVDQLCQDILHREQNKADVLAYQVGYLSTQANGMGHHDLGVKRLGELFDTVFPNGMEVVDDDASGWDLSVPRDGIIMDGDRRISRIGYSKTSPQQQVSSRAVQSIHTMADLLETEALSNSSHVVAIGQWLFESQRFGITASGVPSTTAQNSPMRQIQVRLAGATVAVTLGDDLVYGGDVPVDRDFLAQCGVRNKGHGVRTTLAEGVEFTSHKYTKLPTGQWECRFLNFQKTLARAIFTYAMPGLRPDAGTLASYHHVVRNSPAQTQKLRAFCQAQGWIDGELPAPLYTQSAFD
jgi:hypothetical protein